MSRHHDKLESAVGELAAEFLERESDRTSLITVTNTRLSDDLRRATVLISVFPEAQEEVALNFARRHGATLQEFLRKKLRARGIPFIDFALDRGEKNRQRLDELSQP